MNNESTNDDKASSSPSPFSFFFFFFKISWHRHTIEPIYKMLPNHWLRMSPIYIPLLTTSQTNLQASSASRGRIAPTHIPSLTWMFMKMLSYRFINIVFFRCPGPLILTRCRLQLISLLFLLFLDSYIPTNFSSSRHLCIHAQNLIQSNIGLNLINATMSTPTLYTPDLEEEPANAVVCKMAALKAWHRLAQPISKGLFGLVELTAPSLCIKRN